MSDSTPSVSVVIPALNASDLIADAVQSIRNQDYENIVEVIVAAGDKSTAEVARLLSATVVENPTGRTPTGLNLAVSKASGEIIVRCDAQSRLPAGYVARAVETLMRTGAANVGGMQIPKGTTYWEKAIAAAMSSPLGSGDARYRIGGAEGPAETVYLGVYDKEKLRDLGGFDERFVRSQDYELNHRIIKSGGTVWFDPQLKVEYLPRGSISALWSQYFQYGKAKRKLAQLDRTSLRWRQVAPAILVLALAFSALGSFWTPWTLVTPVAYLGGLLAGGAITAPGSTGPALVIALGTMHLAWGVGFLAEWRRRMADSPQERTKQNPGTT